MSFEKITGLPGSPVNLKSNTNNELTELFYKLSKKIDIFCHENDRWDFAHVSNFLSINGKRYFLSVVLEEDESS
jgi:hypothetical protein